MCDWKCCIAFVTGVNVICRIGNLQCVCACVSVRRWRRADTWLAHVCFFAVFNGNVLCYKPWAMRTYDLWEEHKKMPTKFVFTIIGWRDYSTCRLHQCFICLACTETLMICNLFASFSFISRFNLSRQLIKFFVMIGCSDLSGRGQRTMRTQLTNAAWACPLNRVRIYAFQQVWHNTLYSIEMRVRLIIMC